MGVAVSPSHVVSAVPTSSGGGLLTLFPCSRVGFLSQETALHKLLQCGSFPWAAALHELPQRGSLRQGAILQEQATPAWVPHGVTSPASKPDPAWAPLSPWGHRFCQEPAPARVPHEFTASFGHPLAPVWGPPWAAGGQPASPWSSPWAAGESLLRRLEHLLPLLHH